MTRGAGIVLCALGALGCGDDSGMTPPMDGGSGEDAGAGMDAGGGEDAGPPDSGAPCAQVWSVMVTGAGATAVVSDGSLVLNSPSTPAGMALDVSQRGIEGDFEATFVIGGFNGASPSYGQAYVSVDVGEPRVGIGGWSMGGTEVRTVITHPDTMPDMDMRMTTATSGEVRFRRTADALTITTVAGSDVAQVMATVPGTLRIGVQIGNVSSMVVGDTGLRVDGFTITGGGGTVVSDAFDCDSLSPL